ncbi:MAG TPA: hypothetical protein VGN08_10560 [Solirubrobacteraceae bacterium]|jgi:hypothetical protein
MSVRALRLPLLVAAVTLSLAILWGATGTRALAEGLQDDGGASWRLEQPQPPPPPPGVPGCSSEPGRPCTPVGLGKIGDIKFWAPNRGVLITAGNGSTIPPGVWAYNGIGWHELANVCGATDGRIAWAGPDEFWTISDERPGQPPNAKGEPAPVEDNTLCRFSGGRVVASYASPAFNANSYAAMHAAGCLGPADCWFAGDPLPAGQTGAFHLHWDGGGVSELPYTAEGHSVQDMSPSEGQMLESVRISPGDRVSEPSPGPPVLHAINPAGVQPVFEPVLRLPLYAPEEFAGALDFLHLSTAEGIAWGAAGPQAEAPPGSAPAQVTVARNAGGSWRQLLGPGTEPSGAALFPSQVVDGIAAEPGTESAWLALDTQQDAAQPSPTAAAAVARISSAGGVSQEDSQSLPAPGEGIGPKGAAAKIACPGAHDCWLATTQGWLFHLTNGEQLEPDTDPAFAGLITERPEDEGVPQTLPDSPPPDDSGLPGETPKGGALPEVTVTAGAERVPVALLSKIHTRVVHGSTLELRFHLAVRARVRLIAKRRHAIVASTRTVTLGAGNRKLLLRLNVHRWPTKLELKTHPLAPLPTVSAAAGSSESVSTRLVAFPKLSGLLP